MIADGSINLAAGHDQMHAREAVAGGRPNRADHFHQLGDAGAVGSAAITEGWALRRVDQGDPRLFARLRASMVAAAGGADVARLRSP